MSDIKQFQRLCREGKLEEAKKFIQNKPYLNIHANNEDAFCWSCANGHLKVAKWLLLISKSKNLNRSNSKPIDISANNDYAFRYACKYGHLNIAKWLLEVNPNINVNISVVDLRYFSDEIKYWLKQLNLINYFKKTTTIQEQKDCSICLEKVADCLTICNKNCKIYCCKSCIEIWLETGNYTCPCYRT